MNGYSTGGDPYEYGSSRLSPLASTANGNAMGEMDRKNMLNTFDKDSPRANSNHASKIVDLKDPIQVHLLTETALTDSKDYEIITQEEVDDLKKQSQLMSQRVESTRTNLAVQSKYRDAAISMAKLYTTTNAGDDQQPGGNRQSLEAERELEACERKCLELEKELFNLEKRLLVPQRRLLEHTAGILQLTHKASKRKNQPQNGQVINGIPGSPESLYTYSHSRNSLEDNENYFDDPSLYQLDSLDGLQSSRQPRKNAIEIPLKSPIREQANQMRGEVDRMREENTMLVKSVLETERKLEILNGSLRETIVKFNPTVNNDYLDPPREADMQGLKPMDRLRNQVEYLESGLVAVQAEQDSLTGHDMGGNDKDQSEPVLTELWDSIQSGFAAIHQQKEDRRKARADRGLPDDEDMSDDEDMDLTEPYSLPAFSERVRWLNRKASTLKGQKSVLKRQIKQQRELNNKSDAEKDEEIERKQVELEQSRQLLDRAEKDATDAQTMLSQALEDAEKGREAQAMLSKAMADVEKGRGAQTMLSQALEDVERSRAAQAEAQAVAQAKLQDGNAKIESLEAQLKQAQQNNKSTDSKVADVDAKMSALNAQLQEALAGKAAAELTTKALEKDIKSKKATLRQNEDEMEALNMTLAELKTEVTIARAELDGAYGSRAERAADVAALKNNAEVVKLQNQITKLKKELAGTVEDLENITKETIGAEREKAELESQLDSALSSKVALEAEADKAREKVAKLQEELDGERLRVPGHGNATRPGAGASMLSEQFRATMREERKKFQEDIREERSRCRKLEEELNRLKRIQGPGKSPLSPR